MRIEFKPLPTHWSYLLSRRSVKQLVADLEIDCRLVKYMGTGGHPTKTTPGLYSAGSLQARGIEAGWCFCLEMWGLPEHILSGCEERTKALLQEDIRAFVFERKTKAVDPKTSYPLERRFFLHLEEKTLRTNFSTTKLKGLEAKWASYSTWWL